MHGKAFPEPDIIFLHREFSLLSFFNQTVFPTPKKFGHSSRGCALRSFSPAFFPCRSRNPRPSRQNISKVIFPKIKTDDFLRIYRRFPSLFHVKHSAGYIVHFLPVSCKICFRHFPNKNPLTGSLNPAGDFLFILNLRFFLHSFPEFPYR